MGIGSTTFGSPFTSGGMAFNYHAVTTQDATVTINDATLALDGDDNPTASDPAHTKRLVQDVPGAEYLRRLSPTSPSKFGYLYVDQQTQVY